MLSAKVMELKAGKERRRGIILPWAPPLEIPAVGEAIVPYVQNFMLLYEEFESLTKILEGYVGLPKGVKNILPALYVFYYKKYGKKKEFFERGFDAFTRILGERAKEGGEDVGWYLFTSALLLLAEDKGPYVLHYLSYIALYCCDSFRDVVGSRDPLERVEPLHTYIRLPDRFKGLWQEPTLLGLLTYFVRQQVLRRELTEEGGIRNVAYVLAKVAKRKGDGAFLKAFVEVLQEASSTAFLKAWVDRNGDGPLSR